jgi:hypothetical protein
LIKGKTSPREKVKALKAQLVPTDCASKMLVPEKHRKTQIVGRSSGRNLDSDLRARFKGSATEQNGRGMGKNHPTYDSFEAVEDIVPDFSSH